MSLGAFPNFNDSVIVCGNGKDFQCRNHVGKWGIQVYTHTGSNTGVSAYGDGN